MVPLRLSLALIVGIPGAGDGSFFAAGIALSLGGSLLGKSNGSLGGTVAASSNAFSLRLSLVEVVILAGSGVSTKSTTSVWRINDPSKSLAATDHRPLAVVNREVGVAHSVELRGEGSATAYLSDSLMAACSSFS